MGLDWGFTLRNKKDKEFSQDLVSFCGWNTKEVLGVIFNDYGEVIPKDILPERFTKVDGEELHYDDFYREVNLKDFFHWGEKLAKIKTIFAGVSDRKIETGQYSKKVEDEYCDLCYDLGIEFDDIIIFSLRRLSTFIEFLKDSDLFESYDEKSKDNYLMIWKSY